MPSLVKVRSGDALKIPADAYNSFVDAVDWVRSQQQSGGAGKNASAAAQGSVVLCLNSSGSAVPRFGVLGIDSPIITPAVNADEFQNAVRVKGVTPVVATHAGRFVIALEPIPNGKIGKATIAGSTVAKLEIVSTGDWRADVKASTAELKSNSTGAAQILWKESGTGTAKWAVVRMGSAPPQFIEVKLTQVGGSAGDKDTAPSWTYDVTDVNDQAIASAVSMTGNGQRVVMAKSYAGTRGRGYFNNSGTFILTWADETYYRTKCS